VKSLGMPGYQLSNCCYNEARKVVSAGALPLI